MTINEAWFIRRGGRVQGPYPAGLVGRYILLGRLSQTDEVSPDGENWRTVQDTPQLIPDVLKADPADPHTHERIEAARRWADERGPERRASDAGAGEEKRNASDRREPEDSVFARYRSARAARPRLGEEESRGRRGVLIATVVVLVVISAAAYWYRPSVTNGAVDCRAEPKPHVDWSQCALEGARLDGVDISGARLNSANLTGAQLRASRLRDADLSYAILSLADLRAADLRDAKLVGANLRHSRLGQAVLQGADLSYANLMGADLAGADLTGAKLDHAIWADGAPCGVGSRGECKRE